MLTVNSAGYGRLPAGYNTHQELSANFTLPSFDPASSGFVLPLVRGGQCAHQVRVWRQRSNNRCPAMTSAVAEEAAPMCGGPLTTLEENGGIRISVNWWTRFDSTAARGR